jgi:shikimate dehydrogenase
MKEVFFAGLLGHPVRHSISPDIFRVVSEELGLPTVYKKINIEPKDFKSSIQFLRSSEILGGWNVTIPYKQKIIPFFDHVSKEVQMTGAANVVHLKNGQLYGYNTDIYGVLKTLEEQKFEIKQSQSMILGAGGAALAVAYALAAQRASKVIISNRTKRHAQKLIRRLRPVFPKTEFISVQPEKIGSYVSATQLFVNATPLGMEGFPKISVLPRNCPRGALAFDLIYRPEKTIFLSEAQKYGLKSVGGLDMLIWQALAAWKIWNGKIPNEVQLKSKLQKYLRSVLKRN